MQTFRAELHVHTVLSPCAEIEMLPPLIVSEALALGIQLLAITDHNATANISAVQQAAAGTGVTVLPGMEVQTREEVHVLCLFDRLEQALTWQEMVDQHLPPFINRPDYFGEQLIVDSEGDFIAREPRLLLTSVDLSLNEVWHRVNDLGGLFIPAHVNRKANGLLENLGLVPRDIQIEALEISRHLKAEEAASIFPLIAGYPLLQSGDVHRLDDFLGAAFFQMEEPSISEIRMAFQNTGGRSIQLKLPV